MSNGIASLWLWGALSAGALGFEPPNAADRTAAIGPTNGLAPALARAFADGNEFEPIPKPRGHDWLGAHHEDGQTFAQFDRGRYNKPAGPRRNIYLRPFGEFPAEVSPPLESLQKFAAAFFSLEVKLLPTRKLAPGTVMERVNRNTRNRQLLAGDLMNLLLRELPADAYCLLGVTMDDLYPEESWNFVFGQAALRERVGVYSFARYDPAFYGNKRDTGCKTLILRRSCSVLAHETGHMFGLEHCIHFRCLMNGSNHLAESDSQPLHLCPVCLRKLHHSVGFDALDRYRHLQKLSAEFGFTDEAKWFEQRVQKLAR